MEEKGKWNKTKKKQKNASNWGKLKKNRKESKKYEEVAFDISTIIF